MMANFVVILPGVSPKQLVQDLQFEAPADQLQVCESPLPGCHGLPELREFERKKQSPERSDPFRARM